MSDITSPGQQIRFRPVPSLIRVFPGHRSSVFPVSLLIERQEAATGMSGTAFTPFLSLAVKLRHLCLKTYLLEQHQHHLSHLSKTVVIKVRA